MKKFIVLFLLIFGFGTVALNAQETETETEIIETETEIIETETETEIPVLEDEEAEFRQELDQLLSTIFAWIGGFTGISALMAFILRFLREKKVLEGIREEVERIKNSDNTSAQTVDNLATIISQFSKREEIMEKAVVNLILLSDIDAQLKEKIIENLQNDAFSVQDAVEMGINEIKESVANTKQINEQIEKRTESLLKRLAEEKKEV